MRKIVLVTFLLFACLTTAGAKGNKDNLAKKAEKIVNVINGKRWTFYINRAESYNYIIDRLNNHENCYAFKGDSVDVYIDLHGGVSVNTFPSMGNAPVRIPKPFMGTYRINEQETWVAKDNKTVFSKIRFTQTYPIISAPGTPNLLTIEVKTKTGEVKLYEGSTSIYAFYGIMGETLYKDD